MRRRDLLGLIFAAVVISLCAATVSVYERLQARPETAAILAAAANEPKQPSPADDRSLSKLGPDATKQFRCLALNVYWEARSEPLPGKFAVAAVTLNRVANPEFPSTVCGVVYQGEKRGRHRCQFSWVCDGKSDQPKDRAAWLEAQMVAYAALALNPSDPTDGALYYHAVYVKPAWAKAFTPATTIGRHVYY